MLLDAELEQLLDTVSDGIYFLDPQRRITFWSKGAERITGYASEQVMGRRCSDNILVHVDDQGTNLCVHDCPVSGCLADGTPQEIDAYLQHRDGYRMPVSIRVSPLLDAAGEVVGAAEVFSDRTPRITLAQRVVELERMALLDPLTAVGNRRYLEMQLASRFDLLQRNDWSFGILFVDIDHFKKINDRHGHDAGDRVLKMIARTMQNSLRSYDLVGRWGGEEFLAIVTNVEAPQLVAVANKLRLLVGHSRLQLEDTGEILQVTVSIGATLAKAEDSLESLVKRADRLMYLSKEGGRNRTSVELAAPKPVVAGESG